MTSAQELERLVVRLTGDGSGYLRMINEAVNATTNAARKIQASGNSMAMLGTKMSIGITLPVMGMIKTYSNFDDAMTKSVAIMTGVSAEMRKEMEKTALVQARNSTTSADKLAEAYYFLGSAGLDATQSMMALNTVDKFAIAGAFDMARATDMLADSQSSLGMRSADATENMRQMAKVADILVKANIISNASVEQFAEALTNDAGAAIKQYNIDLEEGIAILAAYADQGLKGVAAGSQMGRLVKLLIKAINDNGKEFKKLNIEYDEFAATGKNVTGVIDGITKAVEGMGPAQKAATLELLGFESLVQQALLPLLGTTDKIREYEKALSEAGGVTEDVAKKQLESFMSQMLIMWNRVKELSVVIINELAPYMEWLADKVGIATAWFLALNDETKRVVSITIGLVAALGPLLVAVGSVVTTFGFFLISTNAIWSSLLKLLVMFKGTKTAATTTATGMKDLGISTVAADVAIVGIGASAALSTPPILALSVAVDKLALSFRALSLSKAAGPIGKLGKGAAATLALPGTKAVGRATRGAAGAGVIDTTATVLNSSRAAGGAAAAASAGSGGMIAKALRGITSIRSAGVAAGAAVRAAIVSVLGPFGLWAVGIAGVVVAMKGLVDWVNGPGSFVTAIKEAGTSMVNFAKTAVGFILNIGTNWGLLIPWLRDNWFNLIIDLGTAWVTFTGNLVTNMGIALHTIVRLMSYTAGAISTAIGNVFSIDFPMLIVTGLEKAAEIFNGFVTKISGMWEKIKNWDFGNLDAAGDQLLNWLADTGEQMIKDKEKGATEESYLGGVKDILKEQGEKMLSPLEGFKSATTEMPDFVTDIFKPVEEAVKDPGVEEKAKQEETAVKAAEKTSTSDVTDNNFKQMSLNQFSVAAIGGMSKPVKKQEVTDTVVASKLDELIGVSRGKQVAVMAK